MNYMNAMNTMNAMTLRLIDDRPISNGLTDLLTRRYSIERERFTELNVENTHGSTFTQSCYSTQIYRMHSTTKCTLSHIHTYIHICKRNRLL